MSVAVYHGGGQEAAMMNPLDVSQTESEYRVVMDLPGVDKEAIAVSFDHGRLTIAGVTPGDEGEGETQHLRERPTGRFRRAVVLPPDADEDSIRARYTDGVLRIRVDRKAEHQRTWKTIKISDPDYPFAK